MFQRGNRAMCMQMRCKDGKKTLFKQVDIPRNQAQKLAVSSSTGMEPQITQDIIKNDRNPPLMQYGIHLDMQSRLRFSKGEGEEENSRNMLSHIAIGKDRVHRLPFGLESSSNKPGVSVSNANQRLNFSHGTALMGPCGPLQVLHQGRTTNKTLSNQFLDQPIFQRPLISSSSQDIDGYLTQQTNTNRQVIGSTIKVKTDQLPYLRTEPSLSQKQRRALLDENIDGNKATLEIEKIGSMQSHFFTTRKVPNSILDSLEHFTDADLVRINSGQSLESIKLCKLNVKRMAMTARDEDNEGIFYDRKVFLAQLKRGIFLDQMSEPYAFETKYFSPYTCERSPHLRSQYPLAMSGRFYNCPSLPDKGTVFGRDIYQGNT